MKILIICFDDLGKVILASPLVRCIKQQIQDVELHFLTSRKLACVPESNPYITKTYMLDESELLMMHELEIEAYDLLIDLQNNHLSNKVKHQLANKHFTVPVQLFKEWVYTNLHINLLANTHFVQNSFTAIAKLNVLNDGKGLDYFIPAKDELKQSDIPAAHSYGFIGIIIHAPKNTQQLPVHHLQELCRLIDYPIILLGSSNEKSFGDAIASVDDIRIYNSCGKFNIHETAALINRAKLIISQDSGYMQMAAAFKKQVISIWGSSSPVLNSLPYFGNSNITHHSFEVKELGCRPCHKNGYGACPKKHFKCMELQDVQAIAQAALLQVK